MSDAEDPPRSPWRAWLGWAAYVLVIAGFLAVRNTDAPPALELAAEAVIWFGGGVLLLRAAIALRAWRARRTSQGAAAPEAD